MATRTISVAGGDWNTTGAWDEAVVPTASDDVVARGTGDSGNLNIPTGITAACRSADFTNYVGTLTHNSGATWNIGTSTVNGTLALKFVAGMNYTITGSPSDTNAALGFVSTSATQVQITTAGKTINSTAFSGAGGSWLLNDAMTISGRLFHSRGTLNTNGKSVNALYFVGSGTNTRTLTLGASTLTFTGATTNVAWDFTTTTSLTFNANTSTIVCSGAGISFVGGGLTYNNVSLTGTGTATITGANTFATLTRSNAAAVTLKLPASTTTTVTGLTIDGSSGNLVSLISSTSGTAATISKSSGSVTANWVSIKDSTATGGATFTASNATNVSGNTGWAFQWALAGTTAGASGTTGAIAVAHSLAGTTAGVAGTTGALRVSYKLIGSTAGVSGVLTAVLTSGHYYKYADVVINDEEQQIRNFVTATRPGGSKQVAQDADSQTSYLVHSFDLGSIDFESDADALAAAQWVTSHYAQPMQRIDELVVKPLRDPGQLFPQVLTRELTDRLTVRRLPQKLGSHIQREVNVEGVSIDITPDNMTVSWALGPADTQTYFVLDDAAYGRLDQGNRLAF